MDVEGATGIQIAGKIAEVTAKRLNEISKEERLTWDRLKDLRNGAAKKLKEVATNGVFQS